MDNAREEIEKWLETPEVSDDEEKFANGLHGTDRAMTIGFYAGYTRRPSLWIAVSERLPEKDNK